jgi:hypothetical protein
MKGAPEMGSGAMIHIKQRIQNVIRGGDDL